MSCKRTGGRNLSHFLVIVSDALNFGRQGAHSGRYGRTSATDGAQRDGYTGDQHVSTVWVQYELHHNARRDRRTKGGQT